MCLGIPVELRSISEGALRTGEAHFDGVTREVCLAYVPEAEVGDFVIVHAGFAICRIDRETAARTLSCLEEIAAAGSSVSRRAAAPGARRRSGALPRAPGFAASSARRRRG